MYLTKREKELNAAKNKGEEDYDNRKPYNDSVYGNDDALKVSYRQGWNAAKSDTERFWNKS